LSGDNIYFNIGNDKKLLIRGYGSSVLMTVDEATGYVGIGPGETAPETLLELTHTTPYLTLHNSTEENADGGRESRLNFKGEQDGTEETTLARIEVSHDGAADDEKGKFVISVNDGDDSDTPTDRFEIDAAGVTHIGDGTNETQIAADGTMTMAGTARVVKELEINAGAISGGASGVVLDADNLPYIGYEFGIGDNMYAQFETPENWDESTDITFKVYWYIDEARGGDTDQVQWHILWKACPPNETESIAAPTHTGTMDFGDQTIPVTLKHLTRTAGQTIAAASLTHGDVIGLDITSVVLDDGVSPTKEPVLIRIEIEYIADVLGEDIT